MPIKIQDGLPAQKQLENENIFVMTQKKAAHQDIRPLKIAILNLMPEKIKTELHLLRRLSNTPIQIEVDLIHPKSHESKNTPKEHLETFYKSFQDIKDQKYDGLIITGAPIEHLDFEQVDYWQELKEIMDWSVHNVKAKLYLCWAAQAALYHHFNIQKYPLPSKQFGIFRHAPIRKNAPLLHGFDDIFYAPHSRHTTIRKDDVQAHPELQILSESEEAGIYILATKDSKHVFVTGHSEYDADTLKQEYERDSKKGAQIDIPKNYFPQDDPSNDPNVNWRSHSSLLYSNWINYYVYQATPFDIDKIQ